MGSREFRTSYITTRGELLPTFSYEAYLAQAMIDTLSIARDLSEAGVDWAQAQAHATVIAHAVEQQHADVATKEFVRNEISVVRGEISVVRGEISAVRGEISAAETRIIRWTVGTPLGVGGLIIAALALF